MKVVFISCCKTKNPKATKAEELYIGELFKKSLSYARTITNDEYIFILSAKYGILKLTDSIQYYEQTLNKMTTLQRQEWAKMVQTQLYELYPPTAPIL